MSNQSFLSVPPNVDDPVVLRRFLSRLLEQLDILYRNREDVTVPTVPTDTTQLSKDIEELQRLVADLALTVASIDTTPQQTVEESSDISVIEALSLVATKKVEIPVEVPIGCIMLWSGSVASIPAGYALCDGANGTPDLRNRFVLAAGDLYTPGEVGGKNEYAAGDVKTELANTVINSSITLTKQSINNPATGTPIDVVTGATINVSADQHLHNLAAFINIPAYYALAYIMRIV